MFVNILLWTVGLCSLIAAGALAYKARNPNVTEKEVVERTTWSFFLFLPFLVLIPGVYYSWNALVLALLALVWAVGLAFATRGGRTAVILIVVLALAAGMAAVVEYGDTWFGSDSQTTEEPTLDPTQEPTPTPAPTQEPTVCPAEFVQNEHSQSNDPEDTRIVAGMGGEVFQILENSLSLPTAERPKLVSDEVLDLVFSHMGENYKALVEAALTFGTLTPEMNTPEQNALLVTEDGNCLSQEGQDLHRVTLAVMSPNIDSVNVEQAPQGLCNSGWTEGGQVVVATTCGLRGDLEAIVLHLEDGRRIYILTRCGNWTFPPNGKLVNELPKGETDNPPEPGKGTSNPESQHGFWGDVSGGGGETTAPSGPSVSDDGGETWRPAKPASPSTKPGSVAPPSVQAPSTGGSPSENNDITVVVPPTGGVTVDPGVSGTKPGAGTPTVPDAGNDNTPIVAPAD